MYGACLLCCTYLCVVPSPFLVCCCFGFWMNSLLVMCCVVALWGIGLLMFVVLGVLCLLGRISLYVSCFVDMAPNSLHGFFAIVCLLSLK